VDRLEPGDPKLIGPWSLVGRLGAGGMARVFVGKRGTQLAAIKVIHSGLANDENFRNRFRREVEALQSHQSPNIANYIDSNFDEGECWLATDYVDGPSLKEEVEINGPIEDNDWNRLASTLLTTLAELNNKGILHRDIKPSNIILSKYGPKLIDFGLAQQSDATSLTTTGMIAGSPAWMSPEIIKGEQATLASDLFSLGSVLVFAKSAQNPWGDGPTAVVFHNILQKDPNLGVLTKDQKPIVTALLSRNQQHRISKMNEFLLSQSKNDTLNDLVAPKKQKQTIKIRKVSQFQFWIKSQKKVTVLILSALLLVLIGTKINTFSNNYNLKAETVLGIFKGDELELSEVIAPSCPLIRNTLNNSISIFSDTQDSVLKDWQVANNYTNPLYTAYQAKDMTYSSQADIIIQKLEAKSNGKIDKPLLIKDGIIEKFSAECNLVDLESRFREKYESARFELDRIINPEPWIPKGFTEYSVGFAYRYPDVEYYEGPGGETFGGWTIDVIAHFGCPNRILAMMPMYGGDTWQGKSEGGLADKTYRIYIPAESDPNENLHGPDFNCTNL
jgi:serine/threonine protein kinase